MCICTGLFGLDSCQGCRTSTKQTVHVVSVNETIANAWQHQAEAYRAAHMEYTKAIAEADERFVNDLAGLLIR